MKLCKNESGILKKSAIRCAITFFLLILCGVSADYAEASCYTTMYTTSQVFVVRTYSTDYAYDVAVLGPGEKVSVSKKEYTAIENGKKVNYRKYIHLGMTCCIPSDYLTTKKPKYSYKTKMEFSKLQLAESAALYKVPSKKSTTVACKDREMLTIGETNYWYKVYYRGTVYFIRKDSQDILQCSKTDQSMFKLSGISSASKENVLARATYCYSLLPMAVRKELSADNCTITITNKLDTKHESIGASGYANNRGQIYLKEAPMGSDKKLYFLEGTFFHEVGHVLEYDLFEIDKSFYQKKMGQCYMEARSLGMSSYYLKSQNEYIAEAFALYVLEPKKLKNKAPKTYQYFNSLYDTVSFYEEHFVG